MTTQPHYIKDPQVTLNSVDLTRRVKECEIKQMAEYLSTTASGAQGEERVTGIPDATIMLNFNQTYDAAGTNATIGALFGSAVAISVSATAGSPSVSNPHWRGTVVINDWTRIAGAVGSLNEASVTWSFSGGVREVTSGA